MGCNEAVRGARDGQPRIVGYGRYAYCERIGSPISTLQFPCNIFYSAALSQSIRDTRLATDLLATVLAGLATIFAQPAATRPLSGAAIIALGVGGDIQSDLLLQQAGDVVGTAVRTRARTELQKKFTAEYVDYTLEQGLVDIQRYDREACNLNVGLNEIRALLNIIGPIPRNPNNPIVPLRLPTTETAAGPPPESAMTGPVATTIIPPNMQNTPRGGFIFNPGKVVTTPAAVPPAAVGLVPPQTRTPPESRPRRPTELHQVSELPCQDLGPSIPVAGPPLPVGSFSAR